MLISLAGILLSYSFKIFLSETTVTVTMVRQTPNLKLHFCLNQVDNILFEIVNSTHCFNESFLLIRVFISFRYNLRTCFCTKSTEHVTKCLIRSSLSFVVENSEDLDIPSLLPFVML